MMHDLNTPTVSVIVPVYGVEKYLAGCIESVIGQTYQNWELILIDDGSIDGSGDICDHYASIDSRIFCIHVQNAGQAVARNHGLDIAQGEFISFLDADDSMMPRMLENLMMSITIPSADISVCHARLVHELPSSEVMNTNKLSLDIIPTVLNQEQAFKALFTDPDFRYEIWNKMYSRRILDGLRFKKNQIHEEIWFLSQALLRSSQVSVIDYKGYNYLINRPGSTNSSFDSRRFALINEFEHLISLFRASDRDELARIAQDEYATFLLTFYKMAIDNPETSRSLIDEIAKKISQLHPVLSEQSDNWRLLLKYKIFSISPKLYKRLASVR